MNIKCPHCQKQTSISYSAETMVCSHCAREIGGTGGASPAPSTPKAKPVAPAALPTEVLFIAPSPRRPTPPTEDKGGGGKKIIVGLVIVIVVIVGLAALGGLKDDLDAHVDKKVAERKAEKAAATPSAPRAPEGTMMSKPSIKPLANGVEVVCKPYNKTSEFINVTVQAKVGTEVQDRTATLSPNGFTNVKFAFFGTKKGLVGAKCTIVP